MIGKTALFQRTQYENIALEFSVQKEVEAVYIQPIDTYDIGNRLIQAMPPMRDENESLYDFAKTPFWSPEVRNKSAAERQQLLAHIMELRVPRQFTYTVDFEIYRALIQCYRLRKPLIEPGNDAEKTGFYAITEGKVSGILITGGSGTGKTTAVMHALHYYPQVIYHHTQDQCMVQIPYIKVECPADGSIKNFLDLCLDEFEKILDYEIPGRKSCKTRDDKARFFKKLAARWNLGMLVIDEIQNLLSNQNKLILNYFLTLQNEIKIPLIFIGTNEILSFLRQSSFFIQRRIGREIVIDRFYNDTVWQNFVNHLWKYQWTRENIPLTQGICDVLYKESGGVIDRAVSLYYEAQKQAIRSGNDTALYFTSGFIQSVSKTCYSISQMSLNELAMVGSGNGRNIPPDLMPPLPMDSMLFSELK